MNSVPNEILSQIFKDCAHNQSNEHFGCVRPSNNEAPLLLLRVCRRWHDCALSTPSLWSRLTIGRGKNRLLSVTAAKDWLDRAAQVPLSLDFCYGKLGDTQSTQNAIDEELTNIFTPSRIWKAVFLEVDKTTPNSNVEYILDAVLMHAPVLESFAFLLTDIGLDIMDPTRVIKIGFTPCLSTVCVHINRPVDRFRLSLSNVHAYGNICDLTLRWPESISHCLHVLDRCPNLEVLRISLRGELHRSPPREPFLTLKKLHTLDVCGHVDETLDHVDVLDFGDFLDALTMPALVHLTVHVESPIRFQPSTDWPCLSQMLVRSQPPLKTFTLLGTYMVADNIVDCLRNMPELIIISGDRELFSTTVMDALTPSLNPMKVPLCPMLAMIGLKDEPASFPALKAMIYSRWKISKQQRRDIFSVQIPAVEVVELPEELEIRSLFLQSEELAECIEDGLELWYAGSTF